PPRGAARRSPPGGERRPDPLAAAGHQGDAAIEPEKRAFDCHPLPSLEQGADVRAPTDGLYVSILTSPRVHAAQPRRGLFLRTGQIRSYRTERGDAARAGAISPWYSSRGGDTLISVLSPGCSQRGE